MPRQPRCTLDLDATEDQRRLRPEGMAVVPDPGTGRARAGQGNGHPTKIARLRHLEIARIAWHDMDRDATGFEQGGLVGECGGAIGREAPIGVAQDVASDPLRRLRGTETSPVDGCAGITLMNRPRG